MEKGTKCLITSFVLAIVILSAVFGCGKRITSTTRTEIKNDSLSIENSIELTQNVKMANIGTLRPLDNSKPMVLNGKYYYNVVIDFDKSISSGIEIKANENLSFKVVESDHLNKRTVKTDYSNIWIGLSVVIGILFVLYLTLKKYIP